MNRLYEKGFIADPRSKAKSVVFTDKGLIEAQRFLEDLFAEDNKIGVQAGLGNDDVSNLLLSAQRALLTHVTQPLRSVSLDLDTAVKMVFVRFIFEREPSDSERDAAACVGTEIISDYPDPWRIAEEFFVRSGPSKMDHRRWIVYYRCEDE